MTFEEIRKELNENADAKYRAFNLRLTPTKFQVTGVRMPTVVKLAKKAEADCLTKMPLTYEEVMIRGLYIALREKTAAGLFEKLPLFLSLADNWAHIDCVASRLTAVKKDREQALQRLETLSLSEKEFELRLVAVTLMNFYFDDEYIDRALAILKKLKQGAYYVDMAIAWALATAMINHYEKILTGIESGSFCKLVSQKALQKALESNRISVERKAEIRALKKRL